MSPLERVDCLKALPLELRERVYLFLGFPVVKEWYHACEHRIVPLVRIEHTQGPDLQTTTIHYKGDDGTTIRCSDKHTGRNRALMATSSFFNAELGNLLYSSPKAKLIFLVGENISDEKKLGRKDFLWLAWKKFERSGTIPPGFLSRRFQSPYSVKHLNISMLWLWHGPKYEAQHLIGWGASFEGFNTVRLANLVKFASIVFPELESLRRVVKNTEEESNLCFEMFQGRQALSRSIASSLCQSRTIRTFRLRTLSPISREETFANRPAKCMWHDTSIEVQAILPDERYRTISRALMYACSRPLEFDTRRMLRNVVKYYQQTSVQEPLVRRCTIMAVFGYSWANKSISDTVYTNLSWPNVVIEDTVTLGTSRAAQTQLADQAANISHKREQAHVMRKLTGWGNDIAPLYTSWKFKKQRNHYCEPSQTEVSMIPNAIKAMRTRY